MVLILFQLALLLLQWLWQPSGDDPLMFFALTFVWGTTSAAWDVLVLGKFWTSYYLHISMACSLQATFFGYYCDRRSQCTVHIKMSPKLVSVFKWKFCVKLFFLNLRKYH